MTDWTSNVPFTCGYRQSVEGACKVLHNSDFSSSVSWIASKTICEENCINNTIVWRRQQTQPHKTSQTVTLPWLLKFSTPRRGSGSEQAEIENTEISVFDFSRNTFSLVLCSPHCWHAQTTRYTASCESQGDSGDYGSVGDLLQLISLHLIVN